MKKTSRVATELTIGMDVGDKHTYLCVLDRAGEVLRTFRVRTTETGISKALDQFKPSRCVLEVGTHSPWMSRLLTSLGHEVLVANPRRVQLIAQNNTKNDRADAELLARIGRFDSSLLWPIKHRCETAQRHLIFLRARDGLVRARTMLVNQVRGFVKSLGKRCPTSSTPAFSMRVRETIGDEFFMGMKTLLETIDRLTAEIRGMEREIEHTCKKHYPETDLLRQVTGVGAVTALCFILTLEDPNRFKKSRAVGAYLGLRCKQRESGNSKPELRITKSGDRMLRRLLVSCAHYILGPFGPDTDLRRFGLRLAERGGIAQKKKGIVAVARKLAVLLHRLWATGEVYEPLGYGKEVEVKA